MADPADLAPMPPRPNYRDPDWFDKREAYDDEVDRRFAGYLSPEGLSRAIGEYVDEHGGSDVVVRRREQADIRRGAPRVTQRVALPAAFSWQDCPVPVLFDGAHYFTSFDVATRKHTGGTTRIVDTRITPNGQLGKNIATLTAPLYKGAATTALPVTALTDALTHGMQLTVYSGTAAHTFIVNGAHAAGATSIVVGSSAPTVDLLPGYTVASPYGKVSDAVTAAVDGDTILIINPGVIWRAKNVTASAITKALSIIGLNNPILAVADEPTWVGTSGQANVYEYARTNVLRIVDLGVDPLGYEYPKATSLTNCNATPGTWWQDSGGSTVHVHPLRGGAPVKDEIIPLLNVAQFNFSTTGRSSASKVYLEGLTILGSQNGVKVDWNTAQPIDFYAKNCRFLWAEQLTSNALNFLGRETILQECVTAFGGADGFNYHIGAGSGATPPRFVEIDCVGHSSGLRHIGTASDPIMNATTAHDGAVGIRIGGVYHHTFGTPVADVHNGTQSANYSCDAFDSLAPDGHDFDAAFRVAEGTAEMWAYGCRAFGTAADLQAMTGVLHATDTQFDTSGGAGTLDIVRPR